MRTKLDPRLLKIPTCHKLPQWVVDWMREQPEAGAVLIEDALMAHYGIKPPTEKPTKPTTEQVTRERDLALVLIAKWCLNVNVEGTAFDNWEDHYKDAIGDGSPLKDLLVDAINKELKRRGE